MKSALLLVIVNKSKLCISEATHSLTQSKSQVPDEVNLLAVAFNLRG